MEEGSEPKPVQRFLWRIDRRNSFAAPDPVLVAELGERAPQRGETLEALSARVGLDGAWSEAVAAQTTFSRVRAVWAEPDGASVALVSGVPAFGPDRDYQGYSGFGVLKRERAPSAQAAPPGDAAALIRLLQRQHAPVAQPSGAESPALAVISALAQLLQPKAVGEARPARRPAPSGAEIVVLHPQAPQAPAADETVALTSQERDNFKAIARALGANVRPHGLVPEDKPSFAAEADAVIGDDFASLVELLPIAILVCRDGRTLFANRTLVEIAGFRDLADFRARDGLSTIFRGRDPRALASGGGTVTIPLVAGGGRILNVDAQLRVMTWNGEPADLVAMRRSYEGERQEEARAMEREAELHAARARDYAIALEAARDGMMKLDRSGRILSMNKGAQALFDQHQVEAAGESVLKLFATSDQPGLRAALERLVNNQSGRERLDVEGRAKESRALRLRLDLGRLAGEPEPEYYMLLTDLGAAPEAPLRADSGREEAEKESEAKTELLLRVSHEMRTPLHAILGFAEVMIEERFGPIGNERYHDYVRDIHASGKHVLALTNDLLDLTRIELGKMELQFAPLDVNAVVRECVTLMQPQAARERVIMRLSLFEKLPNVMADERSLRQILINLMANAVKYNEPGGQVIVSTALDDAGAVLLRVRDTGIGMNDSELALALEPFRRVPGAKPTEGAGIGLPLTKALVEANNADFTIKSRKDQGTLVEIAFPVQRAAQ